jgi:hypothetical protein
MSKVLFLFNGPPGSGKDAIANYMINEYRIDGEICKFADNIRNTIFATFPHINADNYDSLKNLPIGGIFQNDKKDITLRQFIIKYAEEFMKPIFGKDIFAKITHQKIMELFDKKQCVFVTDLGKDEEIDFIYKNITNSDIEIVLVQVYRKGCSFINDSRTYIDKDVYHSQYCDNFNYIALYNNSTLKEATEQLFHFL